MSIPLVSVICTAYNHEPYIRQCLDGFVMQKTNFKIEILISDDASTDNTAQIIKEYEQLYPDLFVTFYHKENLYSQHINFLITELFANAKGKYIALCEGDDYWTDPLKLQKQVDFLEGHEEYGICCHRYKIYNERTKMWGPDYCNDLFIKNNNPIIYFNRNFIFSHWITKTMTLVFQKDLISDVNYSNFKYFRDVHLVYIILSKKKGVCLPFDGAVYRKNEGGICGLIEPYKRLYDSTRVYKDLFNVYKTKELKNAYKKVYCSYLIEMFRRLKKPIIKEWTEYLLTIYCILIFVPQRLFYKIIRNN